MGLISGCYPESSRGLTTFPGVLLHTQPILPASSHTWAGRVGRKMEIAQPEVFQRVGKRQWWLAIVSPGPSRKFQLRNLQVNLGFLCYHNKDCFSSSIQLSSLPSLSPPLPPDLTSLKAILSLPEREGLIQALWHNHCLIKSGRVSRSRMVSRGLNFTSAQN